MIIRHAVREIKESNVIEGGRDFQMEDQWLSDAGAELSAEKGPCR